MLNRLKRKNSRVFGGITMNAVESNFYVQRKSAAFKLQNPRLKRITFHTFRRWKATMEYHRTKDILHVKQLLGHKDINTTLIYTQIVSFESNEFIPRRARSREEEEHSSKLDSSSSGMTMLTKKIFAKNSSRTKC